jgi:hypothetical protein
MLEVVLLLLLGAVLGVVAFTIGLVWWMFNENAGEPSSAAQPLSVTQMLIRNYEESRAWRALSSWFSEKPAQIEDWSDRHKAD